MNSRLHLAFLFASPLVMPYKDGIETKWEEIQKVDHQKELSQVIQGLAGIKNNIRYRKICATQHNLLKILTEGTVALHFAGHGAKNNEENFPRTENPDLRNEGDFLIFEDEQGISQYVSGSTLKKKLESSETELQFVFVASCHSEKTGSIFHQAGAKHVICIRQNQKISDEAQIAFSQEFYQILFSQSKTICQAFQMAKESIKSNANKSINSEFSRFIIIRDCDDYDKVQNKDDQHEFYHNQMKNIKKHNCLPLGPFNPGQIEDIGQESRPLFKLEMASMNDFIGRSTDMCDIICKLNQSRLVTIIGIPGIGKTTIAKSVAIFLEEREKFRDGIIYISMRRRYQSSMLISQVLQKIKDQLPLEERRSLNKVGKSIYQSGSRRQSTAAPQNQIQEEPSIKMRILKSSAKEADDSHEEEQMMINQQDLDKIIYCLSSRHVLIIVDNAEDPLNNDNANFKGVLQQILDKCPDIKLLITSRLLLEQVGNIEESFHQLNELSSYQSVKLFFEKSKVIDSKQVVELLMLEEKNEMNPINTSEALMPVPNYYRRLMKHPLFQKLNGHPHAISMIAPMAKDNTLVEIYNLLNSKTFVDSFANESHPLSSLKLSLETSMKSMLSKNPKAIDLWCLLGLLPGGLTGADLEKLWGSDWYGHTAQLLRASLIKVSYHGDDASQSSLKTYNLLPFMDYYSWIINEDREEQHLAICRYFTSIMFDAYLKIDTEKEEKRQQKGEQQQGENQLDIKALMILHETNIWAILDRIAELNAKTKLEPVDQEESLPRNHGEGQGEEQEPGLFANYEGMHDVPMDRQFSRVDHFDRMLTYQDAFPQEQGVGKVTNIQDVEEEKEETSPKGYQKGGLDVDSHLLGVLEPPPLLRKRSSSVMNLPSNTLPLQAHPLKAPESKQAESGGGDSQGGSLRQSQAGSKGEHQDNGSSREGINSEPKPSSRSSQSSNTQNKLQPKRSAVESSQDMASGSSRRSGSYNADGNNQLVNQIGQTDDAQEKRMKERAARRARQSKPLVDMDLDRLFNMGNDSDSSYQQFESNFSSLKQLVSQRKPTIRERMCFDSRNDADDNYDDEHSRTRIIGTRNLACYMSDNEESKFFYSGQNAMRFGKGKDKKVDPQSPNSSRGAESAQLDEEAEEEKQREGSPSGADSIERLMTNEMEQQKQMQSAEETKTEEEQEAQHEGGLQQRQIEQRRSLLQDMAQFHQQNDFAATDAAGSRKQSQRPAHSTQHQISKQYLMRSNTLVKVDKPAEAPGAAHGQSDEKNSSQPPANQVEKLQLQIPTQEADVQEKKRGRAPNAPVQPGSGSTPVLTKRTSKSTDQQVKEVLHPKENQDPAAKQKHKGPKKQLNVNEMNKEREEKRKLQKERTRQTQLKVQQDKLAKQKEEIQQKQRSKSKEVRAPEQKNAKNTIQGSTKASTTLEQQNKVHRTLTINGHLFQLIEFPIEGKLIIYFASNLILIGHYGQAIRVLSQYGMGYFFQGDAGHSNFANVAKLLAIAYFQQKTSYNRVEELLNQAQNKFRQLEMTHGMAVCSFAKAFFFNQQSAEFVGAERSEDDVVKMALSECENAIKNYRKIKHLMGEAGCLQLRNEITKRLGSKDRESSDQAVRDLHLREKKLEQQQKSEYIQRCQGGSPLSLMIEASNKQLSTATSRRPVPASKYSMQRLNPPTASATQSWRNTRQTVEESKHSFTKSSKPKAVNFLKPPGYGGTQNSDKRIDSKGNMGPGESVAATNNQGGVRLDNLNPSEKSPGHTLGTIGKKGDGDQAPKRAEQKTDGQMAARYTTAESTSDAAAGNTQTIKASETHCQSSLSRLEDDRQELSSPNTTKAKLQVGDDHKLKKNPPPNVKRFTQEKHTSEGSSLEPQSQDRRYPAEESKARDDDDDDARSNLSAYLPNIKQGGLQNTLASRARPTQLSEEGLRELEQQTPERYEIMSQTDCSELDNVSFLSGGHSYNAYAFQFKGRQGDSNDEEVMSQQDEFDAMDFDRRYSEIFKMGTRRESHVEPKASGQNELLLPESATTAEQPDSSSSSTQIDHGGSHSEHEGSCSALPLAKQASLDSQSLMTKSLSNGDSTRGEQDVIEKDDYEQNLLRREENELRRAMQQSLAPQEESHGMDEEHEREIDLLLVHEQNKMEAARRTQRATAAASSTNGAQAAPSRPQQPEHKPYPRIQVEQAAESLDVELSHLTDEQKSMIESLYDMYRAEPDEAERTNIRIQISQFLALNKIPFSQAGVVRQKKKSWDPSKDNAIGPGLMIPADRKYYDPIRRVNQNNSKIGKSAVRNQLLNTQRMNMKTARNMLKSKPAKASLLPQQEVINEQDEEQESDSEMPQIASNTTFKETFDEDDKYAQYHQMIARQADSKPKKTKVSSLSSVSEQSKDDSPGIRGPASKSLHSGGIGHNLEERKISARPQGYQAKRDQKRMALAKKDAGQGGHAEGGIPEEEKEPQDRQKQEEPRKSGLVKSAGTLAGSLLKGVFPKFYSSEAKIGIGKKHPAATESTISSSKLNSEASKIPKHEEGKKAQKSSRVTKTTIPTQGIVSKTSLDTHTSANNAELGDSSTIIQPKREPAAKKPAPTSSSSALSRKPAAPKR